MERGQGVRAIRLDKFLKVSRIIKRRTVANEACDIGRVSINGRSAKASAEVKPGDIIEIAFGSHTGRYEVLDVREANSKYEASELYREIGGN
jgi:ribosomal 50S subunit-recycling heat shock protein